MANVRDLGGEGGGGREPPYIMYIGPAAWEQAQVYVYLGHSYIYLKPGPANILGIYTQILAH